MNNFADLNEDMRLREQALTLIGRGISLWAIMEGNVVFIFAKLTGMTVEKAGIVLYSMGFSAWLTVITDLFAFDPKHQPLASEWNTRMRCLRRMNDVRTRLAHHTTFLTADNLLRPGSFDLRPKTVAQSPLTEAEISDFIDEIIEMTNSLTSLSTEIN